MSKHRRRPGRLWWLGTSAVGVYSPRKGQRRVDSELKAKDDRILELEAKVAHYEGCIEYLKDDNSRLLTENNDLSQRLEIAEGIRAVTDVKMAAKGNDADTVILNAVHTT